MIAPPRSVDRKPLPRYGAMWGALARGLLCHARPPLGLAHEPTGAMQLHVIDRRRPSPTHPPLAQRIPTR